MEAQYKKEKISRSFQWNPGVAPSLLTFLVLHLLSNPLICPGHVNVIFGDSTIPLYSSECGLIGLFIGLLSLIRHLI